MSVGPKTMDSRLRGNNINCFLPSFPRRREFIRPIRTRMLKPGDELEIVSASTKRITIAKDERRALAVERMRARAWPMPEGYAFDREEANAR